MHHASGRWGIVRADWVDHPAIGVDEIAVLAVLSLYASREGRCWPSQSTVAERLKRGRAWVNRVIARLVVLGLVTNEERVAEAGRRATRLYTLVGHAEVMPGATGAEGRDGVLPCGTAQSPDGRDSDRESAATHKHQPSAESGISPIGRAAPREPAPRRDGMGYPTVPQAEWQPTAEDRACALAVGVDPDQFAALFVASCNAHGYRYRDHSAAYRTWLLNRREKTDDRQPDRLARSARQWQAGPVAAAPNARRAANADKTLAALHLLAG
jgi:hypothetical protein